MKIAQQYFNRGNSKIFLQDYEGAIINFDKGIEIDPRFAKAYYRRGIAKNFSQNQDGVSVDFTKAFEIDPSDAELYPQKGRSFVYSFKDTSEAIADFDKAIEINPKFARAYYSRGLAKNYFQNQAGIFEFTSSKEHDYLLTKSSGKKSRIFTPKVEDYHGVIADFDKAIEIDPEFAEAYYSRGMAKNFLQHRANKIYDFNQSAKIKSETETAAQTDGFIKEEYIKNCLGAIADFDKAIEIDPDFDEAYYCRGIARNYLRYQADKIADTKKSKATESENRDYDSDCTIYDPFKNYIGAITDFDMAIKINPLHAKAYYCRGLVKNYFQDHLEEIVNFTSNIIIQAGYTEPIRSKEQVMNFRMKNYTGAISDFDKAIEINPKFAKAYYHRGIVKGYYNDYQGAILDFTTALEINPAYEQALAKRELLNSHLENKKNSRN
jgi:tetratricopeptide (TPR) repeat protein